MWDGGKFTKFKQGEYVFSIRQFAPFKAIKVLGDYPICTTWIELRGQVCCHF